MTTSPIAQAVAALKTPAVEHAAAATERRLVALATDLLGQDLAVVAPFPRSTMSRIAYKEGQARYALARRIMRVERASTRHGSPEPAVAINAAGIAALVQEASELTAAAFDAYVAKLEGKVGECDTATVEGMLWSGSVLTVTKGEKVERWSTQQIVNVSVLGKVFNQWPTRLLKK